MSDPMNSRTLIQQEIRAALRDDDVRFIPATDAWLVDDQDIERMAARVHEAIWGPSVGGSGEGTALPLIVPGELQDRQMPADGATLARLLAEAIRERDEARDELARLKHQPLNEHPTPWRLGGRLNDTALGPVTLFDATLEGDGGQPGRFIGVMHTRALGLLVIKAMKEAEAFREALEAVRKEGCVCAEYEICDHVACASSYAAWAIADAALKEVGEVSDV